MAVLPFADLTADLIAELRRRPQLDVVDATSARLENPARAIGPIGRELRADYVLEGNIGQVDGRPIIMVQLIRMRDESQVWAGIYDRETTNLTDVPRQIARKVAEAARSGGS